MTNFLLQSSKSEAEPFDRKAESHRPILRRTPKVPSTINSKDLQLLATNGWLSDGIIYDTMERLLYDHKPQSDDVGLMSPAVTAVLKTAAFNEWPTLFPKDLTTKKLTLLPMSNVKQNNTSDTHWYLLVYISDDCSFRFYDSAQRFSTFDEDKVRIFCDNFAHLMQQLRNQEPPVATYISVGWIACSNRMIKIVATKSRHQKVRTTQNT